MGADSDSAIVDAILQRVLKRFGGRQVFLFGPESDPFWAAETPVTPGQLERLDMGLSLLATSPGSAQPRLRGLLVPA